MDNTAYRVLHDAMLASKPSGAVHDPDSCPYCASKDGVVVPNEGGVMSDKTYSQTELDTAVAAAVTDAVKPLREELDGLKASKEEKDFESRIATAKAELEEQIKSLQGELDTANLKAEQATKQHEDLVAALEQAKVEQEAAAELARRRDERLAKVREVASFSDEYIEKAADRWAALSDEDFAALVADWVEVAGKKTDAASQNDLPPASAMTASRSDADKSSRSALREVMDLSLNGVVLSDLR
jgi:uncharacterized protein YhaN